MYLTEIVRTLIWWWVVITFDCPLLMMVSQLPRIQHAIFRSVMKALPWKTIVAEDCQVFTRDQPSISLGGPVTCAAWRQILGWKSEFTDPKSIRYSNSAISKHKEFGFFHDISKQIKLGEKSKTGAKVDWPLRGIGQSLQGNKIDGHNFKQALIITFLGSNHHGCAHLNFTVTNAYGVWAALRLFDPRYADSAAGAIVAREIGNLKSKKYRSWQLVFDCNEKYEELPYLPTRKIPTELQLIGSCGLDHLTIF